jgi:hypothetical protein
VIAYKCKLCGALVTPGVSRDGLEDHLLMKHPEKFPEDTYDAIYDARGGFYYLHSDQVGQISPIDCREYFQRLDGVKVYKIWREEQHDRIFLVFARSEAEALGRYRRGAYEFYHSPCAAVEHLWGKWKELSGIYVWMAENLTQGYEEVQAYEIGRLETPCGPGYEGLNGVPRIQGIPGASS